MRLARQVRIASGNSRPSLAWLCLGIYLCIAAVAHAGGPLRVAGVTTFNPGLAGTPLAWQQGAVAYYTDQGDLSPVLPQAQANALVADAFLSWTSVPTAALSATRAGQLDEDVNGGNVSVIGPGQINMPVDIQSSALAKPVAIVYDFDGKVTDALLGQGAGAPDMCGSNAAYGGPDNYTPDAHLAHALVVLNGNCALSAAAVPDLKYHLLRVLGRVLGLDWMDLNGNVFSHRPYPTPDDYLGFPIMHAFDPICPNSTLCFTAADQLKMDDRAAISRLYPVTGANIGSFSGKQVFSDSTARVHGTVYFRGRNALPGQPMQGVKVVARWIDPGTGQPSRRYTAASVSGFLFRGNAGNPVTGFSDAGGERYDKFGANDPALEGYFDLAGLEFPDNRATAQYQLSLEPVDPLCTEFASVGPYRSGQVAPSGTTTPITVTVSKGAELMQNFVIPGSALPNPDSAGSFAAPARVPASGNWAGFLSPYGNVDYYWLSAHVDRTMSVKVTALEESAKATLNKAQPVIGIWQAAAPVGSAPDVAVSYFNSLETGATVLKARFLTSGSFKIGIADFRGDGRPDFRYRGRIFYGDSASPARVATQSNASLTVRGIGLDAATTATINNQKTPVIAALSDRIVLATPSLPDGVYSIDLQAGDGSSSSLINALTYGAAAGDQILLLQGAANPATPVGGEAPNPIRVRVLTADGVTPVPGATVHFSASPAGVSFSSCAALTCALLTDAQGEASSRITPTVAGAFTVTAAISSSAEVHATLSGVASAAQIAAVSPSAWVAQGGTGAVALTVRVLANGQPVTGRTVQYAVTQGKASLSSATAVSDAGGYAAVSLNLSAVAAEVRASACVMPNAAPCSTFYIYAVPASALRLQYLGGEQQIINTAQTFSAVRLRVTDSSSPPNAVRTAPVAVLSAVLRWQAAPGSTSVNPPLPPAPVVLSSAQRVVYSDATGVVSITPAADARFGAVVVKMIAWAGGGTPLQFEVQRLWAPAGWVSTSSLSEPTAASRWRLQRRLASSPRYRPTD